MQREPERDLDGVRNSAPWDQVVADAVPCDHIVQLYQEQDFHELRRRPVRPSLVSRTERASSSCQRPHWNAIRPRLEAEGVDVRCGTSTRTADGG